MNDSNGIENYEHLKMRSFGIEQYAYQYMTSYNRTPARKKPDY
jgi:hypothetical protein